MSSVVNKVKNVLSHHDDTTSSTGPNSNSAGIGSTPTHTSAGDRAIGTDATATHASSGLTEQRAGATTGSSATTATTGAGLEGKVERGAEHLREHAHPPAHHHAQPTKDALLDERGAAKATHDHQHLAPVTHETRHHHEVEEIERQREIDRHVHHIQHHVQPVLDTQHAAEVHHEKAVPVTQIKENHVATDEDKAQFAALKTVKDSVVEAPREKTIIDRGEQVIENKHDHVHHIVQPVIERETHEHHRIHTVIPVHQHTEEAPIVHSSIQHEPMSLADFTAGGGDLSSKLKHSADLLNVTGQECERVVDGPAEQLTQQFGLSSLNDKTPSTTSAAAPTSASTTGARSSTGAQGTTGGSL